jgi:serine/threonine protein kinase
MVTNTKKNSYIKRKHIPSTLTKKNNTQIKVAKDVFSKIEIINELGAGMIGTTYLAKYKGKNYALKIQHILPDERKKSFKSDLWREYDFYGYINTLSSAEQKFFTKLYHMQIYDHCTHIQKSPYPMPKYGAFAVRMRKLDESPWCVKYLMDYHGTETLERFIQTKTISNVNIISFALQIINIVLILYRGGYSHNDLHPGNIMVKPTATKTFKLSTNTEHKITRHEAVTHSNNGLQLVAIDYGNVLHAKYHMADTNELLNLFMKDRQTYLFSEIFDAIANIIFYDKSIHATGKKIRYPQFQKQILAKKLKYIGYIWNDGMNNIITKHSAFVTEKVTEYMAFFPAKSMPNAAELIDQLFVYLTKKTNNQVQTVSLSDFIKHKSYALQFWNIMIRVYYEFMYYYPEEFARYFARSAVVKIPYSESIVIGFLRCGNVPDLVNLFVKLSLNK